MLVIFRNPKDTLASFYHFYNNNPVLPSGQAWDSFFSNFMKGEGEKFCSISVLLLMKNHSGTEEQVTCGGILQLATVIFTV